MEPILRKAQQKDAPGLADLIRSIGWFHRLEHETPEQTASSVADLLAQNLADSSHTVYVAVEEDGRILGFCAVHWLPYLILAGPEGYISELFLREEARGAGTGGRLLAVVEEEARQRGCSRLHLLNARLRESYQRGFYARHGFEEREDMASFIKRLG